MKLRRKRAPMVAGRIGIDALLICLFAASVAAVLALAQRWNAPIREAVEIDLAPSALPGYVFLSLSRGFAAYFLSLTFTLVYGTVAANSRRAERVLIPLLDIGQGIPVLGFLPGLVIGLVALFPKTNVGLELACVIMIFTGQVWNMTFSYFGSLRAIPMELREVSRLHGFSWWQTFRKVEFPSAAIGLVWNSMMSMAGGWFFLTVNEAFTLGGHDFRLPGIGAYMAVAIEKGDTRAIIWAIAAMILMIVAVDQLVWKPLAVWSERFRVEESSSGPRSRSFVVEFFRRSRLILRVRRSLRRYQTQLQTEEVERPARRNPQNRPSPWLRWGSRVIAAGLFAGTVWGVLEILKLLSRLPASEWWELALALLATGTRTALALAAGVLWALPAGILLGRSPVWARRLQPVVQVAASFPAPMLYPLVTGGLLMLHVPFGAVAAVLMLLGAQWYILFNVLAGASSIAGDLAETADVYGLSGWKRWRVLYLPSVFPHLVTGLVTAAGGAWNASIVAEALVYKGQEYSAFGLGSLITEATRHGNFPLLAAGVVTMSLALVFLNRTVWQWLYRLSANRFALNR